MTRPWALILAGAVFLLLAFPPFHLFVPSFIALVPLYRLLERAAGSERPVLAGWYGVLAGLAANGALFWWMPAAFRAYIEYPVLGFVLVVLLLSLYWGLFAWWTASVWVALPRVPRWVVFAAGWTTMEWVIGHGPLAFPWLGLGTSLTGFPGLVQWADVAGARGVTFWLAAVNALVALALAAPARRWLPLLAIAGSVVLAIGYGTLRARFLVIRPVGRVLLVQTNEGIASGRDAASWVEGLTNLITLTERRVSTGRPDLVLWPEAAIPEASPAYLDPVALLARRAGVAVVTGTLEQAEGGSRFNSAVLVHRDGTLGREVYRKRRLVPVAERGAIEPGKGRGVILRSPLTGGAGMLVCYEIAFEELARDYRRNGAGVLLNISNDAWARSATARAQHAAHAVMRAIETRMGVARAANTGPSLVVDPLGRITARTLANVQTGMTADLATSDDPSWYVRLGDWIAVVAGGLVLWLTAMLLSSSRRSRADYPAGW